MRLIPALLLLLLGLVLALAQSAAAGKRLVGTGKTFLMLQSDGQIFGWGRDSYGQLATGMTRDKVSFPLQMLGVDQATDLCSAESFTCVVNNGAAKCAGSTQYGVLGYPTDSAALPSLGVVGGFRSNNAVQIFCGWSNSCAIDNNNHAFCWGDNNDKQLAQNLGSTSVEPVSATMMEMSSVSIGDSFICMLSTAGQIYCAGDNGHGQLGRGNDDKDKTSFGTPVLANQVFVSLASGEAHTCAGTASGQLYAFGKNSDGQLGLGSDDTMPQPTRVGNIPQGVKFVAAAEDSTFAIVNGGSAMAFGDNDDYALGNGNNKSQNLPMWFDSSAGTVVEITGGDSATCVLTTQLTVWCLGSNHYGQLGQGDGVKKSVTLVQVPGLPTPKPTRKPTPLPTAKATKTPTIKPTRRPTTAKPTAKVTLAPTRKPTRAPTAKPTLAPTAAPTTKMPTALPTVQPTLAPTHTPTIKPTMPTKRPTLAPTKRPTTLQPTKRPTTLAPTKQPTLMLTAVPTIKPTVKATGAPTSRPTALPTLLPTQLPTPLPTLMPTAVPTLLPTGLPTLLLTLAPTVKPTAKATNAPTMWPTRAPTAKPTVKPTGAPTSKTPTVKPTLKPTSAPTIKPTLTPTAQPTTKTPTLKPTLATAVPTASPTLKPTLAPTRTPTIQPTMPTKRPTLQPTQRPTTLAPTKQPTTLQPTKQPTVLPGQCIVHDGVNKASCTSMISKCKPYGVQLVWAGAGCTTNGVKMQDGGCQCAGYCGYTCSKACNESSNGRCKWNSSQSVCTVAKTGKPYVPPPADSNCVVSSSSG